MPSGLVHHIIRSSRSHSLKIRDYNHGRLRHATIVQTIEGSALVAQVALLVSLTIGARLWKAMKKTSCKIFKIV